MAEFLAIIALIIAVVILVMFLRFTKESKLNAVVKSFEETKKTEEEYLTALNELKSECSTYTGAYQNQTMLYEKLYEEYKTMKREYEQLKVIVESGATDPAELISALDKWYDSKMRHSSDDFFDSMMTSAWQNVPTLSGFTGSTASNLYNQYLQTIQSILHHKP